MNTMKPKTTEEGPLSGQGRLGKPKAMETPHEADAWIAEQWMGKTVREVSGMCNLGRTGKVVETLHDENGKLHCQAETSNGTGDYFWCPACCLVIV